MEAIVEVLCRSDQSSPSKKKGGRNSGSVNEDGLVEFNGSNLVAPLWREQSLVGGVYSSAHVHISTATLPNTCGWAEIYRGPKNGCKVSKVFTYFIY